MAKEIIKQFGSLVVKMDTGSTDSYDKKPAHVSFVVNGRETISHFYLDKVNDYVGRDADEKDAIYWLRDNKSTLINKYNSLNK